MGNITNARRNLLATDCSFDPRLHRASRKNRSLLGSYRLGVAMTIDRIASDLESPSYGITVRLDALWDALQRRRLAQDYTGRVSEIAPSVSRA